MNNIKRTLAAVALAGAALASSGSSQAMAVGPEPGGGLINAMGIAGNANSNEDSSNNHNVSAGNNQQFSGDGNLNTVSLAGQTLDEAIGG
ncbi:hypothetical protein ACFYNN_36355 [Streptomyces sp. NPDC006978]|uniref:hypothetical protein n=1 Tax=Streptomyces sp. NPDC006978 TaxID=3364769 RepID=UPI0036CDFB6B